MAPPSANALEEYLQRHQLQDLLHRMANDVARAMPSNPIDFMIDSLLKTASASGEEPALMTRLKDVRATLAQDQAAALALQTKAERLEKENAKLQYRIEILNKTLDDMDKAGGASGAAAPVGKLPVDACDVPLGHSAFSWAGGVSLAAPVAGADGSASCADSGALSQEPFSGRVRVSRLIKAGAAAVGETVVVCGWVRTNRKQKDLNFIEINDGSCLAGVQVVVDASTEGRQDHALSSGASTGASMRVTGKVVESPGHQETEVRATKVELLGSVDGQTYPLAKKGHTLEHLREQAHLRPRTNTIGAVMRVRNQLAYATHSFFQQHGFMYVHTPIVTASDCEGAGEMFQITTHTLPPGGTPGKYEPADDFFAKEAYLTVSGQLNGEYYACALSSIYTFGPTFRAEKSHTTRHLAEFWMIEPEIAFADLGDDMNLAEAFLKHCFAHVLKCCDEDLAFLSKMYDPKEDTAPKLRERLQLIVDEPFERITYTEAVELCVKAAKEGKQWEFKPEWGEELQTEHERYICESVFHKPCIVYNYPKGCKAFYMRLNDDNKTVAAMDVLFPKVGEMVGGSQREERLDVLLQRMKEMGLPEEPYKAYLDTRRCGTQKHAGFGVGFERLVLYATAMENIRDVIPFPRWHGSALF